MCDHRFVNRGCPICKRSGKNAEKNDTVDIEMFYSACPKCSTDRVGIDRHECLSFVIAEAEYVFTIHRLVCHKCDFRWWTRIRAAYYCRDCDLIWDVSSATTAGPTVCARKIDVWYTKEPLIPAKG